MHKKDGSCVRATQAQGLECGSPCLCKSEARTQAPVTPVLGREGWKGELLGLANQPPNKRGKTQVHLETLSSRG